MNTFTLRKTALATLIGVLFAPAAWASDESGKRIDNARVELRPLPPSAERQAERPLVRASGVSVPACEPGAQAQALPMRISVDGVPLDPAHGSSEADLQRCADVALAQADIQVRYDPLAIAPALNVWATPNGVLRGQTVEFRAWSNYLPWIVKAELRLFRPGQRPEDAPLAVLPLDWRVALQWQAPLGGDEQRVYYLLRVYDAQGRFDETGLKPLELLVRPRPAEGFADQDTAARERLVGHGENSLQLRNIPVRGGTVTVNGSQLQPGQSVTALGLELPVDAQGKFATKQIFPAGPHTVEVRVRNPDGSASTFRRNLSIASDDWFYVAIGDLTIGRNRVSGPASLVTGNAQHFSGGTFIDGRAAFYLKGKIRGEWLLTAAADTREQAIEDLFRNFSSKDPRYLLRNIDPNAYYPVFGDDSTTVDDAPTQGRFYVRLERGDSHIMWGNFQTVWSGTELLQYSRGLYGAQLRYRSEEVTAFGERRSAVDAFAADPGTLAAREEFRGSGGSLYHLRNMAITQGSERVWIEVRDRDSGLVIERRQLMAAQDYEINYLQGRLLLTRPLASSGAGFGLVMPSAAAGNPLYLVVTYEYVPGLTAINNLSTGLRLRHWVNDQLQLGVTHFRQGEGSMRQTMQGLDLKARYRSGTWLKLEVAQSEGAGTTVQQSQDAGFGFHPLGGGAQRADAYRIEVAADLADLGAALKGKVSAYVQERERGFSAPGQIAAGAEAVAQQGLQAEVELAAASTLLAKLDHRDGETTRTEAVELGLRQRLGSEWSAAIGLRRDQRSSLAPNASQILSQNGARTDLMLRAHYQPDQEDGEPGQKEDWDAYGFVQSTLEHDPTRPPNDRIGLGANWQINDRLGLMAELSDGDLGLGGRLGADFRISDRSNAYLNYVIETDNPDAAGRGRQGVWVMGGAARVSDTMRVFGETRATHGAGPQSLSNAFGLDWAPNDRWNYGLKAEVGEQSDPQAGDLDRVSLGLSLGYSFERLRYSGNLEWRDETGEQTGTRITWLVRNTLSYQANPALRLLGRLNWSHSESSRGEFFDGNFHELVLAAAWRPVDNDRWNTLFKYTNLYHLPTPGQLTEGGANASLAQPHFAQRSQVLAIDTIYELKPWLSVGGKYAVRWGELKLNRSGEQWFGSRADLLVLRADLHFVKEWDALLEYRSLRAREARDARSGWLLGVYRHLGNGIKLGLGYNFTNYSDDLTDLSYRARGWFINIVGTM